MNKSRIFIRFILLFSLAAHISGWQEACTLCGAGEKMDMPSCHADASRANHGQNFKEQSCSCCEAVECDDINGVAREVVAVEVSFPKQPAAVAAQLSQPVHFRAPTSSIPFLHYCSLGSVRSLYLINSSFLI